MRDNSVNFLDSLLDQSFCRQLDRSSRIAHVVDQDRDSVLDVSYQQLHPPFTLGSVPFRSVAVDQGEIDVEAVGEVRRTAQLKRVSQMQGGLKEKWTHRLAPPASGETMTTSCQLGMFSLTHLFHQSRAVSGQGPVRHGNTELSSPDHTRFSPEVINGNFKEPLDLRSVEIHRDDMVAPSDLEHVGDKFRGDWRARLVFSVLYREREHRMLASLSEKRSRRGSENAPCEHKGSKG